MKQKKYNRKHMGENFTTKEGYVVEVIDGGSSPSYCTIRFDDSGFVKEVTYNMLKKRGVKNPYHRSVYGVGFFGVGPHKRTKNGVGTKAYVTWRGMIGRCYYNKFSHLHPTYQRVEVCDDWHNFQNFASWFKENYIPGYCLDKDLLSDGKKIYSPESCLFIPVALNAFLPRLVHNHQDKATGVTWRFGKWIAAINDMDTNKWLHLGNFNSKSEAVSAYNSKREEFAKVWRDRMRGILPDEAIKNIK